MDEKMLSAFVTPAARTHLSESQFTPATCRRARRHPRPLRRLRTAPVARVRRGHKPDPQIPESLFEAEPILDIDFGLFDFSSLKGNVVFVVNVASNDTFTESNYKMMSELYDKYHASGFRILAYPSNWYGQKETGTGEEIKKFVHSKWGDKFHLMSKVDLDWDPVFALGCKYFPGEVVWNFHGKFLFDRQGIPIERFDLLTTEDYIDAQVQKAVLGSA